MVPPPSEQEPAIDRHGLLPLAEASLLRGWRAGRIDPGRLGVAALALVAVLAAALSGVVVLRSRPQSVAVPSTMQAGLSLATAGPGGAGPGGVGSGGAAPAASAPAGPVQLVVAVNGKVARPGLVRVPAGSRVDDAVRAAGGPLAGADLSALNLARPLGDGEQVLVGVPQPAGQQAPAGPGPAAATGGPVDLNAATQAQLESLPGIGAVLAGRIVEHRTTAGRFTSVDQLREVSGIGESKFQSLKDKVRV